MRGSSLHGMALWCSLISQTYDTAVVRMYGSVSDDFILAEVGGEEPEVRGRKVLGRARARAVVVRAEGDGMDTPGTCINELCSLTHTSLHEHPGTTSEDPDITRNLKGGAPEKDTVPHERGNCHDSEDAGTASYELWCTHEHDGADMVKYSLTYEGRMRTKEEI